jgi:hypothetical protein
MMEDNITIEEVNGLEKVALIDADSILYYCCKAGLEFHEVKAKLDRFMNEILGAVGCTKYVAFTSDSDSFRKKIGFTRPYKGNRSGRETPELLYALKAYAQREWGFYTVSGFEADDCVSLWRDKGIICSPDKDVLRQIPGLHYNYQRAEFIRTTEEEAFRFLWLQTAAGDSVDGVPGIPGIGMKKAEDAIGFLVEEDIPLKVLQMYITSFKDTEGFKAAADRFKEALDLVYLLRDQRDLERLGLEMPILKIHSLSTRQWDTEKEE